MLNVIRTKEIKKQIEKEPWKVREIVEAEKNLGICITDQKGYYKVVNKRYADIYGYSQAEMMGKHFTLVVPKDNQGNLNRMHDRFIKNAYEILRNWEVVRKDGARIKIQADAGFFDNILDMTPHKVTFIDYED